MATNRLSMLENAKLVNYISEHFAASGLSEVAFAAKATEALGFAVNKDHVGSRRNELGIPANVAPKSADVSDVLQMIYDLTQKIADLKERVLALEFKQQNGAARGAKCASSAL